MAAGRTFATLARGAHYRSNAARCPSGGRTGAALHRQRDRMRAASLTMRRAGGEIASARDIIRQASFISGHSSSQDAPSFEVPVAIHQLPTPTPILPASQTAPRVSIGVPVFNGARFLEHALDSLLAQTLQDVEIVISDNASTDETEVICKRAMARDPRVRYWRSPVNRGLVWNHRRVLAMATGEYFMFAPHDDWFAPEYVERCVMALQADPEISYVVAETILVDEAGVEMGREVARQRLADPSPTTRFWDVLVVQGGINWYGVTRRALLAHIHAYRPLPRGERIVLAELALWGKFHRIDGDLYYRRIHDNQNTMLRFDRGAETRALDPSRTGRVRDSIPILLTEYVFAYVRCVATAPLGLKERIRGFGRVARWVLAHVPVFALGDPRTKALDIRLTGEGHLPEQRKAVGY